MTTASEDAVLASNQHVNTNGHIDGTALESAAAIQPGFSSSLSRDSMAGPMSFVASSHAADRSFGSLALSDHISQGPNELNSQTPADISNGSSTSPEVPSAGTAFSRSQQSPNSISRIDLHNQASAGCKQPQQTASQAAAQQSALSSTAAILDQQPHPSASS